MAPQKTPVNPGLIDRVVQGVRYLVTTASPKEWFGPGQAVEPQAQDKEGTRGRAFDFPVAYNTRRTPRDGEGITFGHMRALADGYDLLRLVIETRKDQMSKMRWKVGPKDPKDKPDARCEAVNAFLAFPDGEHDWDTWLRMLLEDMLVLDAATVYPRLTLGGELYALELVDGATIKRLLDPTGRTPMPPDAAYQQVLKGIPAVAYSRDELIYRPRNARTNRVYGYGPVEQVIMTVNIAIRRQMHQLQYYTEGNIPEAMIGVPEDWNVDQIKLFQEYWDSTLEGDTAKRRHAIFVPGGITPTFTKEAALTDKYDEWLARIIAFAFSISPQALVAQMNRATAETADQQAKQEGLQPVMNWVKNLMDYVVWKYFGHTDLEFRWEEEEDLAPLVQAQVNSIYIKDKVLHPDEVRSDLGRDPLTAQQKLDLNPPPPPGLEAPGGAPPGQAGGKVAPAAKTAPAEGGTGKPLGKTQGSGLLKVKKLSRTRASCKACTSAITELMEPAFAALRVRAVSEMGKATKTKSTIETLTFDELKDLMPELREALEAMSNEAAQAALAQVLSEITPDQLAQVNAHAVAFARDRSAALVTDISNSTRDMLRDTITTSVEEGWSNSKLAAELEDMYVFSPERAETIARTETAYADIQGNLQGYRASGQVTGKQWIIAQDEYCDECNDLDGVVVGLSEPFPDGGDGPPLHPNCRCDVLPVLSDE